MPDQAGVERAATTTPEALKSRVVVEGAPVTLYGKLRPGPGRSASEVAAHQRARIHSAMIELVAEHGYGAVTVRDLAATAGVSSRTFYEHFRGMEDCFLRTHGLVVRRAVRRIVGSQAVGRDWKERLWLGFGAFAAELEHEPRAARLALVDAYQAGPAATEQTRRAESTFAEMIGDSLSRAPEGPMLSPLHIEGIVAGIAHSARARLAGGDGAGMEGLGEELFEWALAYRSEAVAALADLDRRSAAGDMATALAPVPSSKQMDEARSPVGDRALILSAVDKLVGAEVHGGLTLKRIRTATGLSRSRFDRQFGGIEDCFAAAAELRADQALAQAGLACAAGGSWEGGIYRMVGSLCAQVAQDRLFARLCFAGISAAGAEGRRCCERFTEALAGIAREGRPPAGCPVESVENEASMGAFWGVVHRYVASGQAQSLPRMTATLSFLLLVPAVDPRTAVLAIEAEQGAIVEKHRAPKLDHSGARRNGRLERGEVALRSLVSQGG